MEWSNKSRGWVYDYETICNCFIAVFRELKNPENKIVFEISPWQNDYIKLYTFLKNCIKYKNYLYSYNGLKFDNQISQFIIDPETYKLHLSGYSHLYKEIYSFAQDTIEASNKNSKKRFKYPSYKNPFIEKDVLQINNYDNPNKRTSLKWLQYSMDWHNIEDMPMPHNIPITNEQVIDVINYCDNDVLSLRNKVILDKEEILLRNNLTSHFNCNLLSASEPQIAKKIFGLAISKGLGISEKKLYETWTERDKIYLDECILDYIKFKEPVFQNLLKEFKSRTLNAKNLKGDFSKNVRWKGLDISYGLGGIHAAKRGIFKSCKDYIIMSFDVVSYYPNLAIKNRWAPAHLPLDIFLETYEGIFHERKKYPKSNPLNYVYKIVLNSLYGLSNESYGNFVKDSQFTMKITCNGQLLLTMLMEELALTIPGSRPIMLNTDGGEILIPRTHIEMFYEICKKWEVLTKLELEYEKYNKLIIADVNNYLGIFEGKEISLDEAKAKIEKAKSQNKVLPLIKKTKDKKLLHYKVKEKGRFELEKALHKNKSFKVITEMLYNYFVHNKPFKETIDANKNIMDFCGVVRAKGNDKIYYDCLNKETGKMELLLLQKTNRYFISNSGCKLIKITEKQKQRVEAYRGYETLLNVYNPKKPFEEYPIDKKYYLERANNELKNFIEVEIKNLNLFSDVHN